MYKKNLIQKENDRKYSRKYREDHQEWKKKSNKKCAEKMKELVKKYIKKNPDRIKAHTILNCAIKKGKINRQPCFICNKEKTDGHHIDYSKPLEVVWLCHSHHKKLHAGIIKIKRSQTIKY
jgi:hypothetical protein